MMYVVIVLRNDFEQGRETIILGISQRGNICQKRLAETILSPVELFGREKFSPNFYFEKFQAYRNV